MLAFYSAISAHLPIRQSLARYQLLAIVLQAPETHGIGIKQLLGTVSCSATAARYQLNALIEEGWLEKGVSKKDKRTKTVKPSPQLKLAAKLTASLDRTPRLYKYEQ